MPGDGGGGPESSCLPIHHKVAQDRATLRNSRSGKRNRNSTSLKTYEDMIIKLECYFCVKTKMRD